jgi:tryptophan synthase alpha chain
VGVDFHQYLRGKVLTGRKLLAPYLCAGYPDASVTVDALVALAEAGADLIELGIPFSDPLADGPVIQAASQMALRGGMTLPRALDLAEAYAARNTGVPLALMSYLNPILAMGADSFGQRLLLSKIGTCIVPDLPPEARGLLPGVPSLVQFVAPNTGPERLRAALAQDPPFLYGVAIFGVTGARQDLAEYTLPFLHRVKALTDTPLLAGFGVSTPDQARTLCQAADGVIVGSALLRALGEVEDPAQVPAAAGRFLRGFREALDA